MQATGSVEQIYVIGAPPRSSLLLEDGFGATVATTTTDDRGSMVFRNVAPGDNYRVISPDSREASEAIHVATQAEHPSLEWYQQQQIGVGYGYLRTRDGTLLSINVLMPGPADLGPYPTLVEYSGYDPSNPKQPQPSSLLASNIGYAVVGVNMRGTGCSGGTFDFFEPLQSLDGYDVIEAVAAQPWVKDHKVGMIGLSYPGISQLFVANTQPPHLAAIAPLSVIADIGKGVLYPGGILNNGFAVEWAEGRDRDSKPGGQPWSQKRIDEGDQTCIDNQRLRGQTPNILHRIDENDFYIPEVADPLSPATFVNRIQVPVFLGGAWQDEQTGGYFATMLGKFTGTDHARLTITNGGHTDALGPHFLSRWMEFLSLFVAREVPRRPFTAQAVLQVMASQIFDVRRLTLEPERFNDITTYDDALARWQAEPRVRVLYENGAGTNVPGSPTATFEHSYDQWPIASTQATALYFRDGGLLSTEPPTDDGADSYKYDPSKSQKVNIDDPGTVWKAAPSWNWKPIKAGKALAYATEPLAQTLVMTGSGSIDLWFKSSDSDTDVQVTLSEIRPDGNEVFVQSGWLRASHRKLDESKSTELRPQQTHLRSDAEPLPEGEFTSLRVELYPFAHVFRAGSRVRLVVDTPGGTRPRWKFEVLQPEGDVTNTVARTAAMPSRVVLPVIPDVTPPAAYPPCPSLRGQPCRLYEEWTNISE